MCISLTVLAPVTLISPIRTSHFFYFYGEKSPASVVKVLAVAGSRLLFWTLHCKIQVSKVSGRRSGKNKFWHDLSSGIINLLFDGLTYNMRRHFAHCSYFILDPSGLGKIPCNSQNILAYYMLNHRIRCMYCDYKLKLCVGSSVSHKFLFRYPVESQCNIVLFSCVLTCISLNVMVINSLRKQPTFHEVTTWALTKRRLSNEGRNSILMMWHYPDLGSASDWLK